MKFFVLWDDNRYNRIGYIGEKQFRVIRERFARGEKILSPMYDLTGPQLAAVLVAKPEDLEEIPKMKR